MKISIITLHRVFNYGSVLQTYATQRVFEKLGHEVEIVDYITERHTNKRIFFDVPSHLKSKFIRKWAYICARAVSIVLKKITFGGFLKKHINLTAKKYITEDDLMAAPPAADVYVTGSDQTFNSFYNEGVDKGFFLEYAPHGKKCISFVASFGGTQLPESEVALTREYLSKYDAISVREDSGVAIVESLGLTATCLIDPTLQLQKSEWLALASKRLVKENYLLLFLLYGEDNNATEMARKIANQKGLKLVKLCWQMKKPSAIDKMMTHRSPNDFLSLFAHADFIVTNSFHGLAFSINLEKQFVVVRRDSFNARIESLLRLMHLEEKLVTEVDDALQKSSAVIDYAPIREILDTERARANQFLFDTLEKGGAE